MGPFEICKAFPMPLRADSMMPMAINQLLQRPGVVTPAETSAAGGEPVRAGLGGGQRKYSPGWAFPEGAGCQGRWHSCSLPSSCLQQSRAYPGMSLGLPYTCCPLARPRPPLPQPPLRQRPPSASPALEKQKETHVKSSRRVPAQCNLGRPPGTQGKGQQTQIKSFLLK